MNQDKDKVKKWRIEIINSLAMLEGTATFNTSDYHDKWWLLGTTGCHLCDEAERLIECFQAVQPIDFQKIDIADFGEALMMQFATTIPVLLTTTKGLNYPFSVLDLQQLVIKKV